MENIAIFGAGGLGREVLIALRDIQAAGQDINCIGFIVDRGFESPPHVHNIPVYTGFDQFKGSDNIKFVVALGDPVHRRRAVLNIESSVGSRFATIIHPNAWMGSYVSVGAGTVVMAQVSITTDVQIGKHVLINPQVSIAHDCILEDFCTLSPAVALAGAVHLSEGCNIGTAACVLPGQNVGRWSKVGAGAVVTRPVYANTTAVGVPACSIAERPEGWHTSFGLVANDESTSDGL